MDRENVEADFVLIQEHPDENLVHEQRRKYFLHNLRQEGLHLNIVNVKHMSATYKCIKIYTPWSVLCRIAEELQIKMPLKLKEKRGSVSQSKTLVERWLELLFAKKNNASILDTSSVDHWVSVSKPFSVANQHHFDVGDTNDFFSHRQRIEIVYELLQRTLNDPNDAKNRGVETLLKEGVFQRAFPLHEPSIVARLYSKWGSVFRYQSLDEINNYFGEKVAFYFAFLDFSTKMLFVPATLGVLTFTYGIVTSVYSEETADLCDEKSTLGSQWMCPVCKPPYCEPWQMAVDGCIKYKWQFCVDNGATLAFSMFSTIWSVVFYKTWKRKEARLASDWDTFDVEQQDKTVRSEYDEHATVQSLNPVTHLHEMHVPGSKRCAWMLCSICSVFLLLAVDACCMMLLVISRINLYYMFRHFGVEFVEDRNVEFARYTVNGLIFVMTFLFEMIYMYVARALTMYECPRTESDFMKSFLWKLFVLQLLNHFIPLGYSAWVKQTFVKTPLELNNVSELCDGGCISEVAELVASLLMARLVIGCVVIDLIIPYLRSHRDPREQSPFPELDLKSVDMDGVYEEFMKIVTQLATVFTFASAFPLAYLVCFVHNLFEIRLAAKKFLSTTRRPVPVRVSGIEVWNLFIDIIIKVGVPCNAAIVAFTSDMVPRLYYSFTYSKTSRFSDYTQFSLSSINTTGWLELPAHSYVPLNLSKCYYQDMRFDTEPYNLRPEIWEIAVARGLVFSIYMLGFYAFMWSVDVLVDDTPIDIKNKLKRRQFIINKISAKKCHIQDMCELCEQSTTEFCVLD